ncbi:MAG TPA: septum formation initiator family protein [Acidimicrobiales bacterium]|nr:septum formation initiator family protein [Acidimicrobiales bacterium]
MKRLARLGVAMLVLLAVLFLAGFPARTYIDQRRALASTSERLEVLKKGNKSLAARADELHSDAAVERLAREQYNLVRPGEEAYAILPGPAGPEAPKPKAAPTHKQNLLERIADKISFWS